MPNLKVVLVVLVGVFSSVVLVSALTPQAQKYVEEVKAVLGPATVSAILKVRDDHSLTVEQKAHKIYDIMKALPESTLRSIPFPPRMRALPAPILEKFRAVAVNKSLTLVDKIKEGEKIIMSLTPEQKKLLPTLADVYQPI